MSDEFVYFVDNTPPQSIKLLLDTGVIHTVLLNGV